MRTAIHRIERKNSIYTRALAIALAAGMIVCATSPIHAQSVANALAIDVPVQRRIETETISVSRMGATPAELTRPSGAFFLRLVTNMPDPELQISIVPAANNQLQDLSKVIDLSSLQKKRRSVGLVDLPPGKYYLRSARTDQPLCTIPLN